MEHLGKGIMTRAITLVVIMTLCVGAFTLIAPATNVKADVIGGEYGAEVDVAVLTELTSGNPASITTADEWKMMTLAFDSLARTDPDTLGSVPWVAESWDIDLTGVNPVVVVTLKEVYWHDGTLMTGSHVASSYTTMAGNSMFSSMLEIIDA